MFLCNIDFRIEEADWLDEDGYEHDDVYDFRISFDEKMTPDDVLLALHKGADYLESINKGDVQMLSRFENGLGKFLYSR